MPLNAVLQFLLLVLVVSGYVVAARRIRVLKRPLAVAIAVTLVGVLVSVLGEFRRGGWAGVPAMAGRSLIGSAWWGALIGAAVWLACFVNRRRR
jgi:hypothetical protein